MAKSTEISDLVKVCKIDLPTFNTGNSGTTQPSSKCYQVTVAQFSKETISNLNSNAERSDHVPPNIPATNLNSSAQSENDDRIIKTEIRMRGNSKQFIRKLKTIEDNWKFKEQFQRRFLPTNESCPKGGHSKIDRGRYCNFLDFPNSSADRKLTGHFKPKQIDEINTDSEIELPSNENIHGVEGIEEEKSSKDGTKKNRKCDIIINKSAKTKKMKPSLQHTGKLSKHKLKKPSIYKRDDNSFDEDGELEYMPYFVTILEKDGSIRYLEDEGISSESELSEAELHKYKLNISKANKQTQKKNLVTTSYCRTKKRAATGMTALRK